MGTSDFMLLMFVIGKKICFQSTLNELDTSQTQKVDTDMKRTPKIENLN